MCGNRYDKRVYMGKEIQKMKKIIVACDSYKGCMSSSEVNDAIADALVEGGMAVAREDVVEVTVSDGGEGMLDAFLSAINGERCHVAVHDAMMRPVTATLGLAGDLAIVEVAQAICLASIEPSLRNPMLATSYGVGEMIMSAYRLGARRFIVGLGGSATSDNGMGMLKAIGDKWQTLHDECRFVVASDVVNPLYGENGAAHVFAPQKGADKAMVARLDARARCFAESCAMRFGYDRSQCPGAGAAGGLGYAFMQFFNAEQKAGTELLFEYDGFDGLLDDAGLVITGEGRSDRQTLMGKLPMRVLEHALEKGVDTWLVSGAVSDRRDMENAGFKKVVAVTPSGMALSTAMRKDVARMNIMDKITELI